MRPDWRLHEVQVVVSKTSVANWDCDVLKMSFYSRLEVNSIIILKLWLHQWIFDSSNVRLKYSRWNEYCKARYPLSSLINCTLCICNCTGGDGTRISTRNTHVTITIRAWSVKHDTYALNMIFCSCLQTHWAPLENHHLFKSRAHTVASSGLEMLQMHGSLLCLWLP